MTEKIIVGWREWLALPDLGIPALKAKIDTGARTSALHAFALAPFDNAGQMWVRFYLHLSKSHPDQVVCCEAAVIDQREVSDSGGHRELRYVISTTVTLAGHHWPIEITLTNRDTMRFPMLLGRTAMQGRVLVDPAASYRLTSPSASLPTQRR